MGGTVVGGVPAFELRLLGPVQAVRAGCDVALGGPRQRAVLALLLLDAGRVVPAGRLVEDLWRGGAPPGAATTLRSYVSRLRAVLGADAPLLARGGGYLIEVSPGQLDVHRFERLVAGGQAALGGGEAAVAGSRFGEALALWRGRALADVADVEPLALEAARLEELRLIALEGRAEADLAMGMHAQAAGELESLVAEYPLRERLWRLLVLALYRCERQSDALAAYRRARSMLATELGLEPSEELRQLERAVLRQQVPPPPPPRRHNLPAQLTSFLGRDRDLAELARLLGRARLVTLTGTGGAGKTRLALEVAAGTLEQFRDGVWLADLAAITRPELVPSLVMEALGVRQTGDVPVMEALRYRLASAELLLLLDNCEHLLDACAELAGGLLRGSAGLRVLATSREPLGIPGEIIYPVPPLALPPESAGEQALAAAPAVRLFLERASATRAGGGGVAAASLAPVARICRELDGLPLAIELAAARTTVLSAEEIESRLADKFAFLAYRRPVADPRHQALKAAIDWSYELLSAPERGVLRALSVFAGDFGLPAAAAVCCGGDEDAALDAVDRLSAKSLLAAERAPAGTRYRLLETVREYAARQLADAGEDGQAHVGHAQVFLRLAEDERDLAVLALEHDNFRAALGYTLSAGNEIGPQLARALGGFWLARGLLQEGKDWLDRALAAGPADMQLRADLLRLLGAVLYAAGDMERVEGVLAEGCQAAGSAGLPAVQARIRVLLAEFRFMQRGDAAGALRECEAAMAVLESEANLEGLADAWLLIGELHFYHGDSPASQEACERAIAYARRSGNRRAELEAGRLLVVAFHESHVQLGVAIARVEHLLAALSGDPWAEAAILQPLSVLYGYTGRFADARAALARARAVYGRSGTELDWATSAIRAGEIERAAGDPAAAERELRDGCEALRGMGERGLLCSGLAWLAEAVYSQGRFGETEQLTEEAEAIAPGDDLDAQARWRAVRAKALARRGQFPAARQLAGEAVALVSETSYAMLLAETLVAMAEVSQLAGEPAKAAGSLRQALRIYQERDAVPLADQTRFALASLTTQPPAGPG
jgi:predicted ATPase/DNA-binding SARP family transcriptional activator